ncbi:CRISPR-associated endonuclease Cas2 [Petrimonas mucosa]|jgi:CRISPR-associated protein Cas2|uniref:CRISPR-associated endoribonuclease Cas2 n=1 Tax=Petrimonas mucosa TaxID=1642646 RepID=A0A1G4G545_9BACT|nr:CRISPR-associated endonuclease Cas2 [Petrimonas mucosa]SCM56336.1 CRISPR-associated endoribonuclease Cas2 {ECO:0000256/HAMAP-Rule:MF_01471} [Petrimonas mucosa]
MICWVIYDIKKDKPRTKISKICKRAGLYRVQKSVFLGSLDENEKDTLELSVSELINEETDSIYIFPMSKNELRQTVLLGQAFDKKLVTDDVKALFF